MSLLFDFDRPIAWFVWVPLVLGLIFWKIVRWDRRGKRAVLDALAAANKKHGTNFPTTLNFAGEIVIGEFSDTVSYCLIFDVNKQMVAVTQHGFCEIKGLDYICEWQLLWQEKSVGGAIRETAVRILVGTSDLKRPTIELKARTLSQGRDWDRQLGILKGS